MRHLRNAPAFCVVILFAGAVLVGAKAPSYRCQEEAPKGTTIADLRQLMRSQNRSNSDSISFSLMDNGLGLFDLDPTSGLLTVAGRLDREAICPQKPICVQRVEVALGHSETNYDIQKLELIVEDVNDNPPFFRQPVLDKVIPESTSIGSRFEVAPAVDLDSPANGVATYVLESEGPFRLIVDFNKVTNTPRLRIELIEALDREKRDRYQLELKAVDSGQPPRTGTLVINVEVADVNDNNPRFSTDSYEATVASGAPVGTVVLGVPAFDPDLGLNGEVRYSMSRKSQALYGDLFEVNPVTGDVTTIARLDADDHRSSYGLVVVAEDLGENSVPAMANVRITVQSSNDHAPVIGIVSFTGSGTTSTETGSMSAQIVENAQQGAFVARVVVTDADFGANGDVRCSVTDPDFTLFPIFDKEFKIVTSKPFDREARDSYLVTVECSDLGTPPLSSSVNVSIEILDEDDNAPQCTQPSFNCSAAENGPSSALLVRVEASDSDEGINGRIEYALDADADQEQFRIDSATGDVYLVRSLDRESADRFDFHVIAKSGEEKGLFRKFARCRVHVTVTDVGDEPPRFQKPTYRFEVRENQSSGTEVGRVLATDRDLAPRDSFVYQLEFSPEDSFGGNNFAIDPTYGVIYTRQVLDREATSHHTMQVRAKSTDSDNHLSDDVAVVFVIVTDVNDNSPVFQFPSDDDDTVHVTGSVSKGHVITKLSAYDRDSGVNSELSYSIVAGNERRSYMLHRRNGTLVWTGGNASASCVDELEIAVQDGGQPVPLSTTSRLYVTFDCYDETSLDRRGGTRREAATGKPETEVGYYFLAITVVLIILIAVLVVIVVKIGLQRRRTDGGRRRRGKATGELDPEGLSRRKNRRIHPSIRGSEDTISGMLITARGGEAIASSSLKLDNYARENEANLQKLPLQVNEADHTDSESEGRDTDSGCVDVSSV